MTSGPYRRTPTTLSDNPLTLMYMEFLLATAPCLRWSHASEKLPENSFTVSPVLLTMKLARCDQVVGAG